MRPVLNILLFMLFMPVTSWAGDAKQDSIRQEQKKRHVMSDGSVYTGQMKLRKPSGTGRMEYVNGDVYEGSYEKGLRKGTGTFDS